MDFSFRHGDKVDEVEGLWGLQFESSTPTRELKTAGSRVDLSDKQELKPSGRQIQIESLRQ